MAGSNGRRNGRMTGMAGMVERQKEWQNGSGYIRTIYGTRRHNGGMACGMVEWSIGGNGRMAGMAKMAGMAERQKEWQMAELQITIITYKK